MRLHFVTAADEGSFPGAVATINAALQFHSDARASVICDEPSPLTAAQRNVLGAWKNVDVVDTFQNRTAALRPATARDKARACLELGDDCEVGVWIDAGCVLCSPIDDVALRCLDLQGLTTDALEDPAILAIATGSHRRPAVSAWAGGSAETPPWEPLDTWLWSPRARHWETVVDFRNRQFVNVSASGRPQRMFCSADPPFWSLAHADHVRDGGALQTYPYLWFLAMLWFGRCRDWSKDPFEYLPGGCRHLLDDLVHFLPEIVQVLPRARYEWNGITAPMLSRMLDGIPRMLGLDGSLRDVMELVALHPWIRRYVEIGGYEGGSILSLALRFMVRDIDFYTVESFMGNLDGTVDGLPLPTRTRMLRHLSRFPGLRVRLVPGASADAAALFDDASIDCVFIDACHTTPAVLHDIDAWFPKLRRPGIMAGDDYNLDSVFAAVTARFPAVNITQHGLIWWVSVT